MKVFLRLEELEFVDARSLLRHAYFFRYRVGLSPLPKRLCPTFARSNDELFRFGRYSWGSHFSYLLIRKEAITNAFGVSCSRLRLEVFALLPWKVICPSPAEQFQRSMCVGASVQGVLHRRRQQKISSKVPAPFVSTTIASYFWISVGRANWWL